MGFHSFISKFVVVLRVTLMIELYWILAGTLVLSGIMLGVYKSLWQVCGYSNPYLFGNPENSTQLGILPTTVIQTGLFVFLSLTSGLTLELVRNHPFMEQDTLISIGITTGVGLLLSLQLTAIRHKPENLRQFLLIWLSDAVIGAVAGGALAVLTVEAAGDRAAEKAAENRQGYIMQTEDKQNSVVSEYLRYDPESGCHIVSVTYFIENRPPKNEIKKVCD